MKYVILRDDDTNALMPAECLEQLYRPFLDRGLPVCLSVIPNVSVEAAYAPGRPEQFLVTPPASDRRLVPIGENPRLVDYLKSNPLFRVAQHGCSHDTVEGLREFDHNNRQEIARRLDQGMRLMEQAGLGRPGAFVAPYDRLSRAGLLEVSRRFGVLSSGWYEIGRIPARWLPAYLWKKAAGAPHWRAGRFIMLSHPGCLLSCHRSCSLMLQAIDSAINSSRLTVLVTHWWEYFRGGKADLEFIEVLHHTAEYLACRRDLRVISFEDVKKIY
jgi:hypothetical protein